MRMEKLKEQEEKKQYSDYLQQVINQKNSFNVRDVRIVAGNVMNNHF